MCHAYLASLTRAEKFPKSDRCSRFSKHFFRTVETKRDVEITSKNLGRNIFSGTPILCVKKLRRIPLYLCPTMILYFTIYVPLYKSRFETDYLALLNFLLATSIRKLISADLEFSGFRCGIQRFIPRDFSISRRNRSGIVRSRITRVRNGYLVSLNRIHSLSGRL